MTWLTTIILLAALDPALSQEVEARAPEGTRVEIIAAQVPSDCGGAYTVTPFHVSGRVMVRIDGARCRSFAWLNVRLWEPGLVVTKSLSPGERLEGATRVGEVERRAGFSRPAVLPAFATASRKLAAGTWLNETDIHVGPPLGTPVAVRLALGALVVEQRGVISRCQPRVSCATLPNGKLVAGSWTGTSLEVTTP